MSDFDDIRPYHDDEVAAALDDLVHDQELTAFIAGWLAPRLNRLFPNIFRKFISRNLRRKFSGIQDIRGFQEVVADYANKLVRDGTTEFLYEGFDKLSADTAYLFISNHRDIAGDSMLLDYALYLNNLETVRIAIGDNLMQREFATSLMRLNKGFFIKRSAGGPRKAYAALLQSSQYIKHSIDEGHSVWIAQREGRSKDGFDTTDPAIIKMFALANRKQPLSDTLRGLNIVPLSISYEFDPCDVLKAVEVGTISRDGQYEKPEGEDLLSLVRGLSGKKGRVSLRLGDRIDQEFETVEEVASEIDRQIIARMEMFPVNYWALSKIDEPEYQSISARLAVDIDEKDQRALNKRLRLCPPVFRKYWLKMYANPVMNRERLLNQKPQA